MSDQTDKKEHVHWHELTQQLGADPSEDLLDYFGGMARFEGEEIENDEFVFQNEAGKPSMDRGDEPSSTEMSSKEHPAATDQDVAKEDFGAAPAVTPELDIDWATAPVRPKPKSKRAEKPKPRMTSKPVQSTGVPVHQTVDFGHWDSLASSLGIEPPPRPAAAPVDIETPSVESEFADRRQADQPEPDVSQKESTKEAKSDIADGSAGYFEKEQFQHKPDPDFEQHTEILDQMFVPPEHPFEDSTDEGSMDTSREFDTGDDMGEAEADREIEGDSHYIEFEIEELDPQGATSRSGHDDRRDKPRSHSGTPSRRSRSRDYSENQGGQRGKRPRSDDRTRSNVADETFEAKPTEQQEKSSSKGHRKQKKLPTWQETVDMVVDANLASRKKPSKRRRGRGPRR